MNPISPANIQPRPPPAGSHTMVPPQEHVGSMISAPVVLPPRYAPRRRIPNVRFAPLFTLDEPQVTSATLAEPQTSGRRTLWMHEGPRELQIIEMGPNGTPLPPQQQQPRTQKSPPMNFDPETGEPTPKKRRSYIKDRDFISKIRGLPEDITSNQYTRQIAPRTEDLVHENGAKAVAVSVHNAKTQTEVVVRPLIDIETIPTSPSATTRWLAETIIAASAFQRPPRPEVISRAAADERAVAKDKPVEKPVEPRPGYENIDPLLQGPMPEVLTSGRISKPSKRKLEMMEASPSKPRETSTEMSRQGSAMSAQASSEGATNVITETDLKRAKNIILDHLTVADPSTKLYSRRKNKGSIAYALHYHLIGKEAFITALWDFSEDTQLIESLKLRSQASLRKHGEYDLPNGAAQHAIEALLEPETPEPQMALPPPPPPPQYMHQVAPQYMQPAGQQFSHDSPQQWYAAPQPFHKSPPRFMNDSPNQFVQEPANQFLREPASQFIQEPTNHFSHEPVNNFVHEPRNHFVHESPKRFVHEQSNHFVNEPPKHFVHEPPGHFMHHSPPRFMHQSPSMTPASAQPPFTHTFTPSRRTVEFAAEPKDEETLARNKKIGAIQTITARLTATVHPPERPADAFDETREETFEDQDGEDFTTADIDAFLMIANGGHPFQHEERLNPLSDVQPNDMLPNPNVKARPTWPALQHPNADHEVINLIRDAIYEKARRTWRPDDFNDAISRILQHIPPSSRRMCDEMERLLLEAEISANHAMQPALLDTMDKLYKSLAEALENNAAVLAPLAQKLKELAA